MPLTGIPLAKPSEPPANLAWSSVGTHLFTGGSSYFSDPKGTTYPACLYLLSLP